MSNLPSVLHVLEHGPTFKNASESLMANLSPANFAPTSIKRSPSDVQHSYRCQNFQRNLLIPQGVGAGWGVGGCRLTGAFKLGSPRSIRGNSLGNTC